MTDRFDALSVRESNGKSYFTKVGVAFPNRSGDGYTVFLDAVPAPNEGQFKILLKTPQPRDGQRQQAPQSSGSDLDDSIPF
jgi:hypothetical protein